MVNIEYIEIKMISLDSVIGVFWTISAKHDS